MTKSSASTEALQETGVSMAFAQHDPVMLSRFILSQGVHAGGSLFADLR
jgi:hypothetical protein